MTGPVTSSPDPSATDRATEPRVPVPDPALRYVLAVGAVSAGLALSDIGSDVDDDVVDAPLRASLVTDSRAR